MERRSPPADEDPEDADTVATADCSRWRNGVERQARPDAHAHQVAAGKASGAKRKRQAMTADQRAARRNEGKRLRRAQLRDAQAQADTDQQPAATQDALRPDVSWHRCSWDDSLQPEHPLRLEYEALMRGDLLAAVEYRINYKRVSNFGNIWPEHAAALRELAAAGADWRVCRRCESDTCRCPEGPRGWLLSAEQRAAIFAQRNAAEREATERRVAREAAEAAAAATEVEEEEHAEDVTELNAMLEADGQESIDDDQYDAFCEWAERHDVPVNADTYLDWQNDADEGEAFHSERRVDAWASNADIREQQQEQQVASGAPPPPPPPSSNTVLAEEQEPWMARNPLANYGSNVGDWQPSGGEHDAWGPPSADDVPIEEGEEAAAPPEATLPRTFAPTARARFFHAEAFSPAQRLVAHTASMPPGEAQHHRQLAPAPVQGADGSVVMEAFDPEGEVPYYYQPDELGQPNYGVLSSTGYGDRDTFYGWLEDSFLRVASAIGLRSPVPPRPPSPPPERWQFTGPDAAACFRSEQALWFRQHGDGAGLQGSRRQQNTLFARLKDRLFGLRHGRANPSGTPRNPHGNPRIAWR